MALTKDTPIVQVLGDFTEYPVAASTKIYQGALVGLKSDGYARGLVAGDLFVGHATAQADNSATATDGAIRVETYADDYSAEVTLSGVAVTDVDAEVFASDDGTLTLTRTLSRVGTVKRYVAANTAVVSFEPGELEDNALPEPRVVEFTCSSAGGPQYLLSAAQNKTGVLVLGAYGIISEVMAGASQDQGVVTIKDSDDTTIATLTPSDGGADAVGDVVVGFALSAQSTGAAAKSVAAGKGIYATVSQATSGSGAAGKQKVHLHLKPLA